LEETLDVNTGGELRVDVPDADIDLRTGSSSQVQIKVTIGGKDLDRAREIFEKMNFRTGSHGNTVTIEADLIRTRWGWGSWGGFSMTVQVELPEQFNADIRTSDGDIRLEALDGNLSLRSSDGDIEVGRVKGSEALIFTSDGDIQIREIASTRIELNTSDGDVDLGRVDGTEIEIQTSDGDISVRDLSGVLTASSGDGDISVDIEGFDGAKLRTRDGDISIRLADGLGADIDFRGDEVVLRKAVTLEGKKSSGVAVGKLNGGGPLLQASSGDGTVTLGSR